MFIMTYNMHLGQANTDYLDKDELDRLMIFFYL